MSQGKDDYSQLLDCSCTMIRKSSRKITKYYESSLRQARITPTQFTILAALANTGPVQITQLANKILVERTGLTRNLNVLEKNGWVDIQIGGRDSRQRIVSLAKGGYGKLDHAIPYWRKAQASIANKMGSKAIGQLRTSLNEMTHAMT
ncbi:MAG: MarR family winged helix-turn-helix transcriptional regulator [Alphaproteobacteria bacterium]